MADTYSITIDLNDDDTLEFLKNKTLRVYKSVRTGASGLPVVWFSQTSFSQAPSFQWTEQYAGFVQDNGNPVPGLVIKDTSSQEMDLGDLLTASDDGKAEVSRDGQAGAITVTNSGQRDWTCGMGQLVNDVLSPICAFDLGGQDEQVIMMPYEKVLLVFESSQQIDTGTVVAEAISPSITVELDGANRDRRVKFRKKTGWSENTETWAKPQRANLTLADVLIVPE